MNRQRDRSSQGQSSISSPKLIFAIVAVWCLLSEGCALERCPADKLACPDIALQANAVPAKLLASSPHFEAFGVLLRLPKGRLLSICREGISHAEDNGRIVMRTSADGSTWSEPKVLFDDPLFDDRNVAGGVLPSGDVVIFWNTWDHIARLPVALFYSRSTDAGDTWSRPVQVRERNNAYGPILILPDRLAICLAQVLPNGPWEVYLHFSFDGGATWDLSKRVYAPLPEVAFTWLGGNKILGVGRNFHDKPLVFLQSENLGETWRVDNTCLRPSMPNVRTWDLVSPWLIRPFPSLPIVDLWYAERMFVSGGTGETEIGTLRSVTFDSAKLTQGVPCFGEPRAVFEGRFVDFGYPSLVMLSDEEFLAQFYAKTDEIQNLFLSSGSYSRPAPDLLTSASHSNQNACGRSTK